jgi:hypothetical protein
VCLSLVSNGFDQDALRGAITQRDPRSAELANQQMFAGNLLNHRRLAEAYFTKPLAKIPMAAQLGDTPGHPVWKPVQG